MISNAMGESTGTSSVILKGNTKEEMETIQEYYDKRYILRADDRVEFSEEARVPYVDGCNELRVLGFFRKDSSKTWTRYKNKVYSIGWHEKIYTLVATDENIKRHQDVRMLCVVISFHSFLVPIDLVPLRCLIHKFLPNAIRRTEADLSTYVLGSITVPQRRPCRDFYVIIAHHRVKRTTQTRARQNSSAFCIVH